MQYVGTVDDKTNWVNVADGGRIADVQLYAGDVTARIVHD